MGKPPETNNETPPHYEKDRAWTKERYERAQRIWSEANSARHNQQEVSSNTLKELTDLIDECEKAVRAHPNTNQSIGVVQQSPLLGELLYEFFNQMKGKA